MKDLAVDVNDRLKRDHCIGHNIPVRRTVASPTKSGAHRGRREIGAWARRIPRASRAPPLPRTVRPRAAPSLRDNHSQWILFELELAPPLSLSRCLASNQPPVGRRGTAPRRTASRRAPGGVQVNYTSRPEKTRLVISEHRQTSRSSLIVATLAVPRSLAQRPV